MKKTIQTTSLALFISALSMGCPAKNNDDNKISFNGAHQQEDATDCEVNEPKPPNAVGMEGGTIVVANIGQASFAPLTFQSSAVIGLSTFTSDEMDEIFQDTTDVFNVSYRLPYHYNLSVKCQRPRKSVEVSLMIPDEFISKLNDSVDITLFAAIEQGGEHELYLVHEIFDSDFSSTKKTVTTTLPVSAFRPNTSSSHLYEAQMVIGLVPRITKGL